VIASALGRAGMVLGLAIFLSEEAAVTFLTDPSDHTAVNVPTLHVSYCEEGVERVLEEAREHGWRIENREFVPMLSRIDRMAEGLADKASLELATHVMEALSHWDPSVRKPVQKEVQVDGRAVKLTWPHEGGLDPTDDDVLILPEALFGGKGNSKSNNKNTAGTKYNGTGNATGGKTAQSPMTYEMKVTLKGSKPPIWRRIQVPAHATLDDLHNVLQRAMGWEDCHLHSFTVKGKSYGESHEPTDVTLAALGLKGKDKFTYCYDFGDYWEHDVLVEKVFNLDEPLQRAVCLKGARACPPEDCGGMWRYQDSLASDNSDEDEMLFGHDPTFFDLHETNAVLEELEMGAVSRLRPEFDDVVVPFRRETPRIGRNEPCPCGSGKKYKKCCL